MPVRRRNARDRAGIAAVSADGDEADALPDDSSAPVASQDDFMLEEHADISDTDSVHDTEEHPRKRNKQATKATSLKSNANHARQSQTEAFSGRFLYESVVDKNNALESVAANWLDHYVENHTSALTVFINFILLCSGCSISLLPHDVENADNAIETLSQIEEAHQPQSSKENLLISSRVPEFKNLRTRMADFIEQFVEQGAARGMIFEGELFDDTYVWVAALSSSGLRPFRHTATLIALTTITCLCEVHNSITNQIVTNDTQVQAESKKARPNKARISELEKYKQTLENHLKGTSQFIGDLFDGYRDVDNRIRVECAKELGKWITILPSTFLDPMYLRYLGWLLSDSSALVRLEVMKILEKFYNRSDFISGLRHFTERFRQRLVQIVCEDVDNNVRTVAVRTIDQVRKCGFLSSEVIDQINYLVLESDVSVQKTAFTFFDQSVRDIIDDQMEDIGTESKIDVALAGLSKDSPGYLEKNWLWYQTAFTLLAEMEQDMNNNITPFYFRVKMMIERVACTLPVLRDWQSLLAYIKSPLRREGLKKKVSNSVLTALQDLIANTDHDDALILSFFSGVTSGILSSPDNRMKVFSQLIPIIAYRKNHVIDQDKKHELKNSVASCMLDFLNIFGSSAQAVTQILSMSRNLNFGTLENKNSDVHTNHFVQQISRQFRNHDNQYVLHEVALTFLCISEDPVGSSLVKNEVDSLQEYLFGCYNSFFDKYPKNSEWSPSKSRVALAIVLRTEQLLLLKNILSANTQTEQSIISFLFECMSKEPDEFEEVDKLINSAINSFRLFFCWIVKDGKSWQGNTDEVETMIKKALKDTSASLCKSWPSCMKNQVVPESVQFKVVKILDSTLCAFAQKLKKDFVSVLDYDEDDEEDKIKPDEDIQKLSVLEIEDRACKLAAKIVLAVLSGIFTGDFNAGMKSLKGSYSRTLDNVLSHIQDMTQAQPATYAVDKE